MKKIKKNDILLVGILLLISAVGFLLWHSFGKEGKMAVVRVNGVVAARYSLEAEGKYPLNGGSNVLVIRDGGAYMESADCPDRICVLQGRISRTGEVITCLPNRLTVTVEGSSEEVDMLSGGGGG